MLLQLSCPRWQVELCSFSFSIPCIISLRHEVDGAKTDTSAATVSECHESRKATIIHEDLPKVKGVKIAFACYAQHRGAYAHKTSSQHLTLSPQGHHITSSRGSCVTNSDCSVQESTRGRHLLKAQTKLTTATTPSLVCRVPSPSQACRYLLDCHRSRTWVMVARPASSPALRTTGCHTVLVNVSCQPSTWNKSVLLMLAVLTAFTALMAGHQHALIIEFWAQPPATAAAFTAIHTSAEAAADTFISGPP
eukprot:scaffold18022_cov22-Tisochrysis_lutea.AAC.1